MHILNKIILNYIVDGEVFWARLLSLSVLKRRKNYIIRELFNVCILCTFSFLSAHSRFLTIAKTHWWFVPHFTVVSISFQRAFGLRELFCSLDLSEIVLFRAKKNREYRSGCLFTNSIELRLNISQFLRFSRSNSVLRRRKREKNSLKPIDVCIFHQIFRFVFFFNLLTWPWIWQNVKWCIWHSGRFNRRDDRIKSCQILKYALRKTFLLKTN